MEILRHLLQCELCTRNTSPLGGLRHWCKLASQFEPTCLAWPQSTWVHLWGGAEGWSVIFCCTSCSGRHEFPKKKKGSIQAALPFWSDSPKKLSPSLPPSSVITTAPRVICTASQSKPCGSLKLPFEACLNTFRSPNPDGPEESVFIK